MTAAPVALDAMGGDHAPAAQVEGALRARAEGADVVLVGDRARLEAALAQAGGGGLGVVDAPERVEMGEDPAIAVRVKRGASVRVAVELLAAGRACAVVSAGPTGATLAAALLALGRVAGVRRPAVGAVLPIGGGVVLVDAGASPDVQPEMLGSFAAMGVAYAQALGTGRPRVGLLNVGAEPGKGNALARDAYHALARVSGFVGNVEPAAVLAGAVDVLVSDGFTGNVFLKTLEAVPWSAEHAGAAALLGVAGDVLVAHGDAGAAEVAASVHTAARTARAGVARAVAARLEQEAANGGVARG